MDINEMIDMYMEDGLTRELAAARVCQDVVLKAISIGPLNRNVTIKGGVVMRSITSNSSNDRNSHRMLCNRQTGIGLKHI
ncbi:hypothetical protein [Butyrivibrio sp. LC3010]|uniref:hypothetical protein n=1 Tax=Butyrivibrio sp. LC3010 TaxID=1280680 RepID=UPI00047E0D56|nr:hypothetical protein [Butyrivibrio sp. LC3010]